MERNVFKKLCRIAYETAGINLKEGKETLVAARVAKRLRALGLASERDYLKYLESDASGKELVCFLDAITTNYTRFMREPDHFDTLSKMVSSGSLPARHRFHIWCAAAATGEEPYTIAITLLDAPGGRDLDFKILATDISTRALKAAIAGSYEEGVVEPLSRTQRTKYLHREENARYLVRPEVKGRIVFRRLNLAKPPFPMKGPLDVVFCRNVMIYFDQAIRQTLVAEIERLLVPGGILFIGHSETLSGITTGLRAVRPSVYRKPAAAASRETEAA